MNSDFKNDLLEGLSSNPMRIPSKYFYDKRGSELFVQIMQSEEYYVTDAEMDIFKNKTTELIAGLDLPEDKRFEIIELGAGDGSKTIHLLKGLLDANLDFDYMPIDISIDALDGLEKSLSTKLPSLNIKIKHGEYFSILERLKENNLPKVILFLGSNMGNLTDSQSAEFMQSLNAVLRKDDKLVLGLDLIKSEEIVLPAYNDKDGITAAFNYNLLDRINRELGADFVVENWSHAPEYNEVEGVAKSFLVSKVNQDVRIKALNQTFKFVAGDRIQTEMSRKYNNSVVHAILADTGFSISDRILDSNKYFANYLISKN